MAFFLWALALCLSVRSSALHLDEEAGQPDPDVKSSSYFRDADNLIQKNDRVFQELSEEWGKLPGSFAPCRWNSQQQRLLGSGFSLEAAAKPKQKFEFRRVGVVQRSGQPGCSRDFVSSAWEHSLNKFKTHRRHWMRMEGQCLSVMQKYTPRVIQKFLYAGKSPKIPARRKKNQKLPAKRNFPFSFWSHSQMDLLQSDFLEGLSSKYQRFFELRKHTDCSQIVDPDPDGDCQAEGELPDIDFTTVDGKEIYSRPVHVHDSKSDNGSVSDKVKDQYKGSKKNLSEISGGKNGSGNHKIFGKNHNSIKIHHKGRSKNCTCSRENSTTGGRHDSDSTSNPTKKIPIDGLKRPTWLPNLIIERSNSSAGEASRQFWRDLDFRRAHLTQGEKRVSELLRLDLFKVKPVTDLPKNLHLRYRKTLVNGDGRIRDQEVRVKISVSRHHEKATKSHRCHCHKCCCCRREKDQANPKN